MKQKFLFYVIVFLSFISFNGFMIRVDDCSIMRRGTFTYGDPASPIKVVIKGKTHIEYHENGKYYIKSTLNWISDCEYNMTMTAITIPDFPYKVGDVMNVKINKVEGSEIFYTSTVQGKSWEGKFTKVKD